MQQTHFAHIGYMPRILRKLFAVIEIFFILVFFSANNFSLWLPLSYVKKLETFFGFCRHTQTFLDDVANLSHCLLESELVNLFGNRNRNRLQIKARSISFCIQNELYGHVGDCVRPHNFKLNPLDGCCEVCALYTLDLVKRTSPRRRYLQV